MNSIAQELKFKSVYVYEQINLLNAYFYNSEIIIRKEEVTYIDNPPCVLDVAYNKNGQYIGSLETIENCPWLSELIDIQPIHESKVCSIGFNEKEQKWYGWSDRAYHGFGIGSEVKRGHIAYVPENLESLIESRINFHDLTGELFHIGENHSTLSNTSYKKVHTSTEIFENTFKLNYVFTRINSDNEIFQLEHSHIVCDIPTTYGRGEWTAKTLDDAKRMAIDYATRIS